MCSKSLHWTGFYRHLAGAVLEGMCKVRSLCTIPTHDKLPFNKSLNRLFKWNITVLIKVGDGNGLEDPVVFLVTF